MDIVLHEGINLRGSRNTQFAKQIFLYLMHKIYVSKVHIQDLIKNDIISNNEFM